ncbi:hypothetical protein ATCC90586_010154 [Pythium insidiosum]|nr:hypothetical protein ATCC90586_010154 [Pythium insidiosum]
MKALALALALISAAPLLVSAALGGPTAPHCHKTGFPCVDKHGNDSRCLPVDSKKKDKDGQRIWRMSCVDAPPACGPGARAMEPCQTQSGEDGLCGPFNGDALSCVTPELFAVAQNYDRCEGKPDGAQCELMYMSKGDQGELGLFRGTTSRCRRNYCQEGRYAACEHQRGGSRCSYNVVEDGSLLEKTGKCEHRLGIWNICRKTGKCEHRLGIWNICRVHHTEKLFAATQKTEWPSAE